MILILNNGDKIIISAVIARQLYEQIVLKKGAAQWQFFTDSDTAEVISAFNLSQVAAIIQEDHLKYNL